MAKGLTLWHLPTFHQKALPIRFIKGMLRQPLKTGALVPSSRYLAKEILRHFPDNQKKVVVEFGAGTGAITKRIQDRMDEQQYLGFELNTAFIHHVQKQLPAMEICPKSAESFKEELTKRNLDAPTLIVSGLPWALFPDELQESILSATLDGLEEGGVFSTFAYAHALKLKQARSFSEKLKKHFHEVKVSKVIWRNLPPAVIYHCRKGQRHH